MRCSWTRTLAAALPFSPAFLNCKFENGTNGHRTSSRSHKPKKSNCNPRTLRIHVFHGVMYFTVLSSRARLSGRHHQETLHKKCQTEKIPPPVYACHEKAFQTFCFVTKFRVPSCACTTHSVSTRRRNKKGRQRRFEQCARFLLVKQLHPKTTRHGCAPNTAFLDAESTLSSEQPSVRSFSSCVFPFLLNSNLSRVARFEHVLSPHPECLSWCTRFDQSPSTPHTSAFELTRDSKPRTSFCTSTIHTEEATRSTAAACSLYSSPVWPSWPRSPRPS